MSDWERRPLFAGQAEYAALDAWVLPLVYARLQALRLSNEKRAGGGSMPAAPDAAGAPAAVILGASETGI